MRLHIPYVMLVYNSLKTVYMPVTNRLHYLLPKDVLVHVRDASHSQSSAQREDVLAVLGQIGLEPGLLDGMIEVLNKTDKL